MNCNDVLENVHIYLDGELTGADVHALEGHAQSCTSCRHQLATADQVRRGVWRALRDVQTPADLSERIARRLDGGRPSPLRHAKWAVPTALAAGLGALWLAPTPSPTVTPAPMAVAAVTPALTPALKPAVRQVVRRRATKPRVNHRRRAAAAGPLRMVANMGPAEVIGGGVGEDFLANDREIRAIRTSENLRALVASHQHALPPEVKGNADRVRLWLKRHAPQHSRLPIPEGAGVALVGARLGHVGPHRVVSFRYRAFGRPVTVVRYLTRRSEATPDAARDHGAVRDHLAGYSIVHAARDGDILSIVGELDHQALTALIEPPSFF